MEKFQSAVPVRTQNLSQFCLCVVLQHTLVIIIIQNEVPLDSYVRRRCEQGRNPMTLLTVDVGARLVQIDELGQSSVWVPHQKVQNAYVSITENG